VTVGQFGDVAGMVQRSEGSQVPQRLREQMIFDVLAFVEALLTETTELKARLAESEDRLKKCADTLFHPWHRYRDGRVARNRTRQYIRTLWWPLYEALKAGTPQLQRGTQ
jgi:hypothetical protein